MFKSFACIFSAAVLLFSHTAFASGTSGDVLGDISMGNHHLAPYAESDIIVPRPKHSVYTAPDKYINTIMPSDINGHWAENEIRYFIQEGYIQCQSEIFNPNNFVTYADFADTVSRLGLKPVKFNGGTASYRIFGSEAWGIDSPYYVSAMLCSEAGIWGNSSEIAENNENFNEKINFNDYMQNQYLALFISNMIGNKGDFFSSYGSQSIRQSDSLSISKALNLMISEGIMSSMVQPQGYVTKAEMISILYNVLENYDFNIDVISNNLYGNYHKFYWDESMELITLVNQERSDEGLKELKYDPDLNALCEIKMLEKSVYGYDTFGKIINYKGKSIGDGHVSRFFGRATEMANAFGLNNYLVSENAATGAPSAKISYSRFKNSSAHRNNYMNAKYEMAGFSVGEKCTYEMFAYRY